MSKPGIGHWHPSRILCNGQGCVLIHENSGVVPLPSSGNCFILQKQNILISVQTFLCNLFDPEISAPLVYSSLEYVGSTRIPIKNSVFQICSFDVAYLVVFMFIYFSSISIICGASIHTLWPVDGTEEANAAVFLCSKCEVIEKTKYVRKEIIV